MRLPTNRYENNIAITRDIYIEHISILNNLTECTHKPHQAGRNISSPDITFCTTVLAMDTLWSTAEKLSSDHLPIIITTKTTHKQKQNKKTFINYKKANWSAYTKDTENLSASLDTTNITETTYRIITTEFNSIIFKTSNKHIPRCKGML